MDLEGCENSPREGKFLGKFNKRAYVRRQDTAKYAEEKD
jgi:hypothetical protein